MNCCAQLEADSGFVARLAFGAFESIRSKIRWYEGCA